MSETTFDYLPLNAALRATAAQLGFITPTEIQRQIIPLLLKHDKIDVYGQAQTGTGKTLAFGLPLLHRIDPKRAVTQGLVVAPTRELAIQIAESLRPFARALNIVIEPLYGGSSLEDQMRSLRRGVHLVVGTPGRLKDHLSRRTLSLEHANTLVLDEADVMLDMGFKDEVEELILAMPPMRQLWLFSATEKMSMKELMNKHMSRPVVVSVNKQQTTTNLTKQYYCLVPSRSRFTALCRIIEAAPSFYGFVFCQTKIMTAEVAERLARRGFMVGALHGDMGQAQRNAIVKKFRDREISIVVATDVAARGIDVPDLTHVINYSLPEDLESYVHRIGRTGRAGKEGTAIALVTKNEFSLVKMLERTFKCSMAPLAVPSYEDMVRQRITSAQEYLQQLKGSTKQIHPLITELVKQIPENDLQHFIAHVMQEQFLKSLDKESFDQIDEVVVPAADGLQEIMLAIGSDDGVTQSALMSFIEERCGIRKDHIARMRIIKRRSFIKVTPDIAHQLLPSLRKLSWSGRGFRPSLVTQQQAEYPRARRGRSNKALSR